MDIVILADSYDLGIHASAYEKASCQKFVAGLLLDRIRLSGKHTFVCLRHARNNHRIGKHLLSKLDKHNVAKHDLGGIHGLKLAVTYYRGARVCRYRQPLYGDLRLDLLHHRDKRVQGNNGKEGQVFIALTQDQHDRNDRPNQVKEGENVVRNYLKVALARFFLADIRFSLGGKALNLVRRQALRYAVYLFVALHQKNPLIAGVYSTINDTTNGEVMSTKMVYLINA